MRTILTVALSLAILMIIAIPAFSQTCGNANGSGGVDLSDVVYLFAYLGTAAPPPPNPAMADVDGRLGITISDPAALLNYFFGVGPQPNCNPTLNYSLTTSPDDTLFFPSMIGVPDGIDTVKLPVTTSMGPGAYGMYFPFLPIGPTANGVFHLGGVTINMAGGQAQGFENFDTTILMALFPPDHPSPVGRTVTFTLNYVRTSPGLGNIVPMLVNRTTQWVPSFSRNRDLFLPRVIYQEQFLPPETLTTTPTQLLYTAMAGKIAKDSFLVSFGSTGIPISFNLTASDPWIILKDLPGTPLTTPTSIWVKANATALGMGSYNGTINISPVNAGTPMRSSTVAVSFDVTKPVVYPPADLNCDGIADLADLSRFVAYLTSGGNVILLDCNQ